MKAEQFYSTQGSRIFDVEASSEEVRVRCTPVNAVGLLTGSSRAVSQVGRHISSAKFNVSVARSLDWQKDSEWPKWFRVVIIDAAGQRAWTNPIRVDEKG